MVQQKNETNFQDMGKDQSRAESKSSIGNHLEGNSRIYYALLSRIDNAAEICHLLIT